MENKPEVPINCFFKGSYNPEYEKVIARTKEKCFQYNMLSPNDNEAQQKILKELIGSMGKDAIFTPPFYCDYGYNISVGDFFYSNHNFIVQDGAEVKIGDYVFIGPDCCITTAEHAIDPEMRKDGVEIAKPVKIGNNVWIGAHSTILAGAVIGDNTVIGAGSVVKGNIPSGVVAVGVPCKVKREITEDDKHTYPYFKEYKK